MNVMKIGNEAWNEKIYGGNKGSYCCILLIFFGHVFCLIYDFFLFSFSSAHEHFYHDIPRSFAKTGGNDILEIGFLLGVYQVFKLHIQ